MRFILFNAIVAGALIYLFSGADQPGEAARRSVDDAMARLAALSEAAVQRAEQMQEVTADPIGAPAAAAPEAPAPQPETTPEPVSAPEPAPRPEPTRTPEPAEKPASQVAAAADAPAPAAPQAVEPLPEREIATVPTHRVPKPGDTGPVAARPADGQIEIAEPMMSSADRRKELFSLAQEMELLYATRVHE